MNNPYMDAITIDLLATEIRALREEISKLRAELESRDSRTARDRDTDAAERIKPGEPTK